MILDYNERKSRVDMFHQNIEEFFCRRKTVCWSLLFFCSMFYAGANNAFILMPDGGCRDSIEQILSQLCLSLAKPAIQARLSNPAHQNIL